MGWAQKTYEELFFSNFSLECTGNIRTNLIWTYVCFFEIGKYSRVGLRLGMFEHVL